MADGKFVVQYLRTFESSQKVPEKLIERFFVDSLVPVVLDNYDLKLHYNFKMLRKLFFLLKK